MIRYGRYIYYIFFMNIDAHHQSDTNQEHLHHVFSEQHTKTPDMLWNEGNDTAISIVNEGMQKFFDALPNKEQLFEQGKKMKLCCIDGRIDAREHDCVYVREGGTGVLRTVSIDDIAHQYAQIARKLGVTDVEITRHEHCGAEGLSKLDEQSIDAYHEELQKKLEGLLQGTSVTRIARTTISTHTPDGKQLANIHDERALYFTKNVFPFNSSRSDGILPKGFVFHSEVSDDASYRIANAQVSIGIAFGSHGFGSRFTPDTPFLLIAVGRDEQSLKEAKQELEQAKQNFIQEQTKNSVDAKYREKLDKSILITGCVTETIQN